MLYSTDQKVFGKVFIYCDFSTFRSYVVALNSCRRCKLCNALDTIQIKHLKDRLFNYILIIYTYSSTTFHFKDIIVQNPLFKRLISNVLDLKHCVRLVINSNCQPHSLLRNSLCIKAWNSFYLFNPFDSIDFMVITLDTFNATRHLHVLVCLGLSLIPRIQPTMLLINLA